MILGIDPGTTCGAAVYLDPQAGTVPAWLVWSATATGYRCRWGEGAERTVAWMVDIGEMVGSAPWGDLSVLAIEGLGSRSWGAQPLIESVGELRAGLRLRRGRLWWDREIRPLAVARKGGRGWRAVILGLGPKVGAKAAEDRAIEWAMGRGLPKGLTRAEQGAWSEARAIAEFAALEGT